ncbi:MAG: DUF2070 family protein [Candidatus Caldarchaeum sp.]|uniref:DUF2070 family protein n=2 Tax=Caldiarchaeum subterraneum TaxID=311458 RepID=A0A7C4I572_CALS0|nr:DUF2070 family protein [Candidatus Caldarchaeales archaeon]
MVSNAAGNIAERYRLIRGFYGGAVSLEALLIMASLSTVIIYLYSADVLLSSTVFIAFLGSTALLNRVVAFSLGRKCPSYTSRRLDSLSVVETGVVFAGVVVSAFLRWFSLAAAVAVLAASAATSVFLSYSVRRAIGYRIHPFLAALLSTPPMLLNLLTLQAFLGNWAKALQISFTSFLVGVVSLEIVRHLIDLSKPIQGIRPFRLLQAFLASLLSGYSRELEEMMMRLGNEDRVGCELFVLRRVGKPSVALVVSDIHPGPFRAVGSSMFPAILANKLAEKGFHPLVLKGLSSHEKNLANIELSEKVAEKIAEEAKWLEKNGTYFSEARGPWRTNFDGVSSLTLNIADKDMVILTLNPQPMEDLPPEVLPPNHAGRKIVVDSHNSFSDNLKNLDNATIEKIRTFLSNFSEQKPAFLSKMRVGYARTVPSDIGPSDGIGAGGVSCIVFEVDGVRTSLVLADANNAMPWVRGVLQQVARENGCVDTELCTTDTHMVNAVSLGGRGYHPLGEAISTERLKTLFDELHKRAASDLSDAEAAHKSVTIENVKVFSDFLDVVSQAVSFGVRAYRVAALAAPLLSIGLATLLL